MTDQGRESDGIGFLQVTVMGEAINDRRQTERQVLIVVHEEDMLFFMPGVVGQGSQESSAGFGAEFLKKRIHGEGEEKKIGLSRIICQGKMRLCEMVGKITLSKRLPQSGNCPVNIGINIDPEGVFHGIFSCVSYVDCFP